MVNTFFGNRADDNKYKGEIMTADRKIFDIHGHNGSWPDRINCDELIFDVIKREKISKLLISNLSGMETENHVEGGNPLIPELEANRQTIKLCKENEGVLYAAAVCQVGKSSPETLEQALKEYKFTALKFHPFLIGIDANDKIYDPYLEIAEANNLPCVFHSAPGTSDPMKIYMLAKRHPKVPVVLYHINLMGNCEFTIEMIAKAVAKKEANLYCDTAWCPMDVTVNALRSSIKNRVMFGSDLPIDGPDHFRYYRGIMQTIDDLMPNVADDYFYNTAARLFLGEE